MLPPECLPLLRLAAEQDEPVYLVGGALRDSLLKRPFPDLDLATPFSRRTALRMAKILKAKLVALDPRTELYRLILPDNQGLIKQVDIARLQGPDILTDLMRRDFSMNALALPLSSAMEETIRPQNLLDPRRGLKDLERKLLRCPDARIFREDPLRLLRAFRIAAQLGLKLETKTLAMIRRAKGLVWRPAGERIQAELMGLLEAPGAAAWIKKLDDAGLLTALFKELERSRACAEVYYGRGGVLKHSLDAVRRADFLLNNLPKVLPELALELGKFLNPTPKRKALILLAVLLHDIAKPACAKPVGGRLRFFGHDEKGGRMARALMEKLKFSREDTQLVSTIITHHLRPGNLASGSLVTDRASYRFFHDIGPHAVSLLLACWADHASYLSEPTLMRLLPYARLDPNTADLSKIRPASARKSVRHLQVVAFLLRRHFKEPAKSSPPKIISGDDVMKTRGLKPCPEVGAWLEKVREAQAEGRVKNRREAIRFLRES